MASKLALVVANTEYTDPGLAQLTAPGKDAKEFGRVLDSRDLCAFDDVIILINETASKVSETIDYFFSLRKPDDLLILYFSGHGVRDEYGALYLAVKNTNRARLRSTAIKADFIREAMDQSRSRRQILILDCCNSGAFAEGTKAETGGSIGTAKAFEGTGYGRIVLTASDSTQFAWEGDKVIGKEITNSLFTHFLVKGLEGEADRDWDGKISVDELYDYTYEQVIRRTPKQTPGKWSYRQQGEIFLRENLKPQDVRPVPLPADLLELAAHQNTSVRRVAVQELIALLEGKHLGLVRSAQEKLREMADTDDSLTLRHMAVAALGTHGFESGVATRVDIPEEKSIEETSAQPEIAASALATFSPLVQKLKAINPLPRLMEWRLKPPKLEKRLIIGISVAVLGIAFLAGAVQVLFNNWSIFGSSPTASATITSLSTSTRRPSPTLTITPGLSETSVLTPTPTLTRTRTATPTLTATPTSTRTPLPTFTVKPTKKKRDTPVPPP